MCATSTLAAEAVAVAEAVGDVEVDAGGTSTSADGGLDASGNGDGSKDEMEKDAPIVRQARGRVEWRVSNRRRMSIPKARRTSIFNGDARKLRWHHLGQR